MMFGMTINPTFKDAIGQDSVKKTLSLYIDAFAQTGQLQFITLVTGKGGGKSFFARKFREGLVRPDGSRPPLLEVNGAVINNAGVFFEQVYPVWVHHNACLFIDEVHNLPYKLQQIFLNVFDIKKNPVRTVEYDGIPYDFDFRKLTFISATTDQQKLVEPLRDRFRMIAFEEYTADQLYEVFESNLGDGFAVDFAIRDQIKETFRGNPRDAVVKAQELSTFAIAKKVSLINSGLWKEFCSVMGVNACGLNHSEKSILKLLASRGDMTLGSLACATGFERSVIQKDYETMLIRKGLIDIDGKRKITNKGKQIVSQFS